LTHPVRPVPTSEAAAHRLVSRVGQALRSQGPLSIIVTEDEITSYLALNLRDTPVREIAIWFTPEGIHLWAKVRARHEPTLRALLTINSHHGVPQVEVQTADLNGHPLPRFLLASLEEAINAVLADAHSPLWVEQVTLSEGSMLVTGQVHRGG